MLDNSQLKCTEMTSSIFLRLYLVEISDLFVLVDDNAHLEREIMVDQNPDEQAIQSMN